MNEVEQKKSIKRNEDNSKTSGTVLNSPTLES